MGSTYPGTLDSYNTLSTARYMDESGYVLHDHLNDHAAAVVAIETTLGTNSGTSVLKDFTAGEFAVARNAGGTVTDTLTKGTANNFTLGTPAITGGTADNTVLGTPAITGGTITTSNNILINGTTAVDGAITFDRTNEDFYIGDGTNGQAVHMGAWKTYSPTLTNVTETSGTKTFAYSVVGKTVFVRGEFGLGTASAVSGAIGIALPVTANSAMIGISNSCRMVEGGVSTYTGQLYFAANSRVDLYAINANTAYTSLVATNATIPFTWGTSDIFTVNFSYEAA